ncbi:uncharacterized protein EV420DRAFT_1752264 [Desarmillaria tabescens]|uniref:Uncharacterized protein n=1 Tax=Armillaria tabescens TaxID=1929756 RepID=A0AA39MQW6_ARMTA|nr:uncharacterized protein EV420DRAFT_1752264 [Desarmillaria tabescens]KAK0442729.1 hypothetical protein EV420DRAFT_1752264 [Desarmillaria tabescens]
MEWPLCQELSDLVVDALVEQGQILRNAALLSRQTLLRTRYHRFKHVVLRSSRDYDKFSDLCTISKTVGLFVDSLEIYGSKQDQAATHASVLERLLELVVSARVVHFVRIPWGHLSFIGKSKEKRYKFSTVYLRDTVVASYHALASFIEAFPKLYALALLSVSLGRYDSVSDLQEAGSTSIIPRIRILEFEDCKGILVPLANDIAQNSAPLSVRRLRILRILSVQQASDLNSIKTILEKSGGLVQKLRVGIIKADTDKLPIFLFPPFVNHLHLSLYDFDVINETDVLRWWIKCFSCQDIKLSNIHISLSAYPHYPHLHRISGLYDIETTLRNPPRLFHLAKKELWSELDKALAQIQGLKEFVIRLSTESDKVDLELLTDAIDKGMPRMRDQGLLEFTTKRGWR